MATALAKVRPHSPRLSLAGTLGGMLLLCPLTTALFAETVWHNTVVLQPSCCEQAPLDGAGLFISSAGQGTAYNSGHVLHQQITWSRVF